MLELLKDWPYRADGRRRSAVQQHFSCHKNPPGGRPQPRDSEVTPAAPYPASKELRSIPGVDSGVGNFFEGLQNCASKHIADPRWDGVSDLTEGRRWGAVES